MKEIFSFLWVIAAIGSGRARAARRQKGGILILVIVTLCLLSFLAVAAARNVLLEQKLARRITDDNASYYAAISVANAMKFIFGSKTPPEAISLRDLGPREFAVGGLILRARFYDEQGRLDIFLTPPRRVLERLPGLRHAPKLVKKISSFHRKPGGFVKEDLLLIDGMTPEIYDQFKDWLTTFAYFGVNINTASSAMLKVIGLSPELIHLIVSLRRHTAPEHMIKALEASDMSNSDRAILGLLFAYRYLSVVSKAVGMDMEVLKNRRKLHSYHAVFGTHKGGFIWAWQED